MDELKGILSFRTLIDECFVPKYKKGPFIEEYTLYCNPCRKPTEEEKAYDEQWTKNRLKKLASDSLC